MIRELDYNDYRSASEVMWKSFYACEKDSVDTETMELFRDLTAPQSLSFSAFSENLVLYGYFFETRLVAVSAVRDNIKISALYVLPEMMRKGIGKELLAFSEKHCDSGEITLDSSDFAFGFYLKNGYSVSGKRFQKDGMYYTPMKKASLNFQGMLKNNF